MMTDPIADMLTRIRNAGMARHAEVSIPYSKLKTRMADILRSEGYISDFRVDSEGKGKLVVVPKYGPRRRSAIAGIRRASRPGRRYYVGWDSIPEVQNGLGIAILSTSRGLMTGRDAREKKVGGEVLCEVW